MPACRFPKLHHLCRILFYVMQESTFRIMDIGGGKPANTDQRVKEESYECNTCNFRTTSMSVLLIHRRAHHKNSEQRSTPEREYYGTNVTNKTRAKRRANTTTSGGTKLRCDSLTHATFSKDSVRCHSRHVSIVVDAPLTGEDQLKVAAIVKKTMASIERVVQPSVPTESVFCQTLLPKSKQTQRRNTQHASVGRGGQHNDQLSTTMAAPVPSITKQRRLTRSMTAATLSAAPSTALSSPAKSTILHPPLLSPQSSPTRRVGRRLAPDARRQTIVLINAPISATDKKVPTKSKRALRNTLTFPPRSSSSTSRSRTSVSPRPPKQQRSHVNSRSVVSSPTRSTISSVVTPILKNCADVAMSQRNTAASFELQQSLLAEWCDDELDESPIKNVDCIVTAPTTLETTTENCADNSTVKAVDPKVNTDYIQESDNNQSVKKCENGTPKIDRGKGTLQKLNEATTAATSKLYSGVGNGNNFIPTININNNYSACCFDFEEDEKQQHHETSADKQNGLSYRDRLKVTANASAQTNIAPQQKVVEEKLLPFIEESKEGQQQNMEINKHDINLSNDELFNGFEEDWVQAAAAAEIEAEREQESSNKLSLPIKERQKRIFKSRNKSLQNYDHTLLSSVPVSVEPSEKQIGSRKSMPSKTIKIEHEQRQGKIKSVANSSDHHLTKIDKRRHNQKPQVGNLKKKVRTVLNRTKVRGKEYDYKEVSSSTQASDFGTSNQLLTPPVVDELSNLSSTASCFGLASPAFSSSTSCSVASNIAVISAEEARELQRLAPSAVNDDSGTCDIPQHTNTIIDATQPVLRGGVLILENIRLPNLYERPHANSSETTTTSVPIVADSRDSTSKQLSSISVDLQTVYSDENSESAENSMSLPSLVMKSDNEEVANKMQDIDEPILMEEEEIKVKKTQCFKEHSTVQQAPSSADLGILLNSHEGCPVLGAVEASQCVAPSRQMFTKREQELLLQNEADQLNGRSAEKCRMARERWSRRKHTIQQNDKPFFEDSCELDALHRKNKIVSQPQKVETMMPQTSVKESTQLRHQDVVKAKQQLAHLRARHCRPASLPTSLPLCRTDQRERKRLRNVISENDHENIAMPAKFNNHKHKADFIEVKQEPTIVQRSATPMECGENAPGATSQLGAGRICAVMTRPIPGYNHTFMLCSLANNNFTPLNNVALYLDNEKNHLVPVPDEVLTEPPRLADGHPLSAVFTDIDFLDGETMGHILDQQQDQEEEEEANEVTFAAVPYSSPALEINSDPESEQGSAVGIIDERDLVSSHTNTVRTHDFYGHADNTIDESSDKEDRDILQMQSQNNNPQLTLNDDQMHPNMLLLSVNGHRLELDPLALISIAEQPDSNIELIADDGDRVYLHGSDILQAAQEYLQERDLQLVNVEELMASSSNEVETLNSEEISDDGISRLASTGIGVLNVNARTETTSSALLADSDNDDIDDKKVGHVYIPPSAATNLTPPITARTNETNALLNQMPIMSTLEHVSGVQLRRVSPLTDANLEDSLAVIGVVANNVNSNVPTSLELPITITNPAIAPRLASPAADIVEFKPF
ncbi:uncharacterized protein LOC115629153 isoform X2 [Scaptodrosophila lebanonensis]|uniref:Uncharacterized protein LOC115629153 isoform X2 n=1 Tax=Drosophila lebanonensis TaxID=7225 RepID=A0A6J2U0F3_DROLE|nr:uncharacterized protein LOC115629153 isoform X2 [Scaptodrosophila lebanonensis]